MLRLWLRSMLFVLLRLKLGHLGLFLGIGMGGTGIIGPRMWGRNEVEPGVPPHRSQEAPEGK